MESSIISVITDLVSNAYVIGGAAGMALHRWVLPPVFTTIMNDIKAVWHKIFPVKEEPKAVTA